MRSSRLTTVPESTPAASLKLERRLRKLIGDRIAAGLTQSDIATRLNKKQPEISRAFARPLTSLPIEYLKSLLEACGVHIRVEVGESAGDEEAAAFTLGPEQKIEGREKLIRYLFDLLARDFDDGTINADELSAVIGSDDESRNLFSAAWLRRGMRKAAGRQSADVADQPD